MRLCDRCVRMADLEDLLAVAEASTLKKKCGDGELWNKPLGM